MPGFTGRAQSARSPYRPVQDGRGATGSCGCLDGANQLLFLLISSTVYLGVETVGASHVQKNIKSATAELVAADSELATLIKQNTAAAGALAAASSTTASSAGGASFTNSPQAMDKHMRTLENRLDKVRCPLLMMQKQGLRLSVGSGAFQQIDQP